MDDNESPCVNDRPRNSSEPLTFKYETKAEEIFVPQTLSQIWGGHNAAAAFVSMLRD